MSVVPYVVFSQSKHVYFRARIGVGDYVVNDKFDDEDGRLKAENLLRKISDAPTIQELVDKRLGKDVDPSQVGESRTSMVDFCKK